jgi:hypothetical protein
MAGIAEKTAIRICMDIRGCIRMNMIDYNYALQLYSRYRRIEARANAVCLDVNTKYLKAKITKMKDLLRGFSLFASQVSKAMTTIADDIKQVLTINRDITKRMN